MTEIPPRFWDHISFTETCFIYTAGLVGGYGTILLSCGRRSAHRIVWEYLRGPIPEGTELDHMCHNPACVRVDHLRIVTHKQNLQNRAKTKAKTGLRGVRERRGRYQAYVSLDGKQHHGGTYNTLEEADKAARALRDRLFTHHLDGAKS